MSISIARSAIAGAAVCLSLAGGASAAAPKYKLVLLDGTSAVTDVANHGWSVSSLSNPQSDQRCQRRTCAPVPSLPHDQGAAPARAAAVNNLGHVAGSSATGDGTVRHAMLFNGTQTIDLGIVDTNGGLGCTLDSSASALNDKGQVAGACTVGDGEHYVAFLWQGGVLKTLGTLGGGASGAAAINRKGHVVGDSERSDSFTHAYVYRHGRMQDLGVLEGDLNSTATGINDAGLIVGNSFGVGGSHAFIHQEGVNTRLPMISGAKSSSADDINNLGWVVGQAYGPKTNHGWVYDGNAVYDLNLLLTNADPRYTVQAARRIADNGHIAADVFDDQSGRTVGATLVPVK